VFWQRPICSGYSSLRLLHVTPTYIPAFRYGGPIYSVHGLCRSLAAAGHDVHVLTTSVNGSEDSDVIHGQPVNLDGVQVHYCRSRWFRRAYWSADLEVECTRMIRDFDVMHLHSVFLFPTWAGARVATKARVPYILSPRGMLVRELIARRNALFKRTWIRLIERRNLAHAARIHLTSEEEHRALVDLALALAPTACIPNGVDVPNSFSLDSVSADVRSIVSQGYDVLSFGRINWKKGLDRLIRSAASIPDAKFIIAGHDEDGLAETLKRTADECGVGNRVQLLPRQVTGADKEALFGTARLFVLPSLSENFGNVVAEAMIRGIPVLVSERVGAAGIVEASGGGVVVKGDEHSFGSAIASLLKSKEQLAFMGKAGANYARQKLTWDYIARRFESLYENVSASGLARNRHIQPIGTS
jgi:glycosyltransferase involved in cell wall biosynthesis